MSFNPDGGGPEMPSSDSDYPFEELDFDDDDDDEDQDEDDDSQLRFDLGVEDDYVEPWSSQGMAVPAGGTRELGGMGAAGGIVAAAAGTASLPVVVFALASLAVWGGYKLYKKSRES